MSDSPTPKKRRAGQHPTEDEKTIAQRKFLTAFAKTANVALACRAAKIHRDTCYEWKKNDADFAAGYALAEEDANDVMEAEIFRRAVKGVVEPVVNSTGLVYEYLPVLDVEGNPKLNSDGRPQYKRGKQITITKFSDTLLMFRAKRFIPAYRDKMDITSDGKALPGLTIITKAYDAAKYVRQGADEDPL